MSLEFGAAAPFAVGPLTGIGRIMFGFYIKSIRVKSIREKSTNVTEIYATFFAGGSASIWIFNFTASLYVRLGQKSGGAMQGLAVFTYSFSMGLADFDFSIRFEKEEKKGFGENTQDTDSIGFDDVESDESWGANPRNPVPLIKTTVQCQSCNWKTYRSYFDTSISFENS